MIIITDDIGSTRSTPLGDLKIKDSCMIRHRQGRIFIRYLYEDLTEYMAKDMRRNVQDHFDNVVIVEGGEGSGKSNLAYWIAKSYDPMFRIAEGYVYDIDDLKMKLRNGNDQHSVFWMDETSNLANNRDWNTTNNKDLVSLLEMMRSRGWTLIMCIPHKERLDVYIRENRIRYLVRCEPCSFDVLGKRERGFYELSKKAADGHMAHVGYGEYTQIPEEDRKIYEQIKLNAQQKKIDEITGAAEKPGGKYKKMYEEERNRQASAMLAMYNSGIDSHHIMDLFGIEDIKKFHQILTKARAKNEQN